MPLHFYTFLHTQEVKADWQGILATIGVLTTLRGLTLDQSYEDDPDDEEGPGEPDADLDQAIATTWPQQLTNLAALDLPWSMLGPAATTAALYDMPSLTSLHCYALSVPTQAPQRQQPVRVKELRVEESSLATLAGLHLSPQCNLDLCGSCLNVLVEVEGPEGEGMVEAGVRLLAAVAADTLRHSDFIGLDGFEGSDIEEPLEAEDSELLMRTLAAGLRGGSHKVGSLEFGGFTFQQGNSAALVELLQAAPLVDSLCFR